MTLVNEMADLLPDEVTAVLITYDGFGAELSRGEELTIPCRVKGGQSFSFVKDGKEVKATTTALLDGVYGVTVDYEFTLPSRYSPRVLHPVHVDVVSDDSGSPDHEKVYFA